MKHIRLYNNYLTKNAYPKEVNDIFFYLRRLIKEYLQEDFGYTVVNFLKIEKNKENVYSIEFNSYRYYIVFQFNYEEDGLWIKYINSSLEPLKSEIDILSDLFNNIAIKKSEYGWNIDKSKLSSELDNIDFYKNSKKYNL
jgi:hypothetical protein